MGLWNPGVITTELWLDSDDAATITESSGSVSEWADKSGNGYTFSATGSAQPTTGTETLDSKNVIVFDGTDDFLQSDSASSTWSFLHDGTEYRLYVVVRLGSTSNPDAMYGIIGTCRTASATRGSLLVYDDRASAGVNEQIRHLISSGSAYVADNKTADGFATGNSWHVLGVSADPTTVYLNDRNPIRLFGDTPESNSVSNGAVSTSDPAVTLRIGVFSNDTFYLDGAIAEIIITTGAEDVNQRQIIEGYLAWRWGLEASLPAGHPYVSAAPSYSNESYIDIPGPLQPPSFIVDLNVLSLLEIPGPLSSPSLLGAIEVSSSLQIPSPLNQPELYAYSLVAVANIPGPLNSPTIFLRNDFTGVIPSSVGSNYVMDLTVSGTKVRVPIKSWQGTLNIGRSNYLQCVIPNAEIFENEIANCTDFTIYRAINYAGLNIEYEMATSIVNQRNFYKGSYNYTATISGYTAGYTAVENPDTLYDRNLTEIRTTSISNQGTALNRVRCSIDLLLRPGQRAYIDGINSFIVSYINYYALAEQDHYMDVGER